MFGPSSWLLRPPLWARWVLSLGVGAILVVALILFVSHNNNDNLATVSPKNEARANREAEIVVSQDQAPHTATVSPRAGHKGVVAAIVANMDKRIAAGDAGAPLQGVSCRSAGRRGTDVAYRCTAKSAGVDYPYQAVLDRTTHTLTYCKHDAPPVPSQNIPVSRRCTLG